MNEASSTDDEIRAQKDERAEGHDGALGVPITTLAVDYSYAVTVCSSCSIIRECGRDDQEQQDVLRRAKTVPQFRSFR
jgi:hypothetical protein